jgi:3-deoxy-D-manno-octulosonate 8-phosphate phosphatase (KDO 8-P phosphatase)
VPVIDVKGFDPLLLERAAAVRALVLDVDGVLTDGSLYFDNQGNELKAFSTRDGLGIRVLQRYGTVVALITGRTSDIVARRAANLKIEHVYQGRDDKVNALNEVLAATGLEERQVCYAGDDWLDIPVLARVGLAVTVPEADAVVKSHAHWITPRSGGRGAVRDICDLILAARGLDQQALDEILGR